MRRCGMVMFGLLVMASGVRGEDMVTHSGVTYTNIVVRRYDRQGLFIDHAGGSAKVPFREILPELRGYYKKLAKDWTPAASQSGEREEPAGTNDLATLSGPIYRDVVVRRIEEHSINIVHEGGWAKVYFSEIPPAQREQYRTAAVVPDTPPGSNDLVTVDGQIFRDIEIRQVEPDGVTFRHAGGVTKLRFPSLPEELRQRHGYDPQAARKYQREVAAREQKAQEEAEARRQAEARAAAGPPITILGLKTDRPGSGQFRITFAVKNHTPEVQTIRAIPYDERKRAVMGGRQVRIPARSGGKQVEIVVPINQPKRLTVTCGEFQTNCTLRW